jgi:serine/threonine protein kinase
MRVIDAGVFYEKHPFLVAEYLPDTLHRVIRSAASTMVERISYAMQLLSAIAYLTSRTPPVVHRDIKPRNVFIKGKSCVLGDFGLMKHIVENVADDRELLRESIGPGMPFQYRTPDQVEYLGGRAEVTSASDVFQVGLVLAELFTGRNPEKRAGRFEDPVELESLNTIRGALGSSIRNVLNEMLEPSPDRRPTAIKLLDVWGGFFQTAVIRSHALEGRAFW